MTLTPVEKARLEVLNKLKESRPLTDEEKVELKALIVKEEKV